MTEKQTNENTEQFQSDQETISKKKKKLSGSVRAVTGKTLAFQSNVLFRSLLIY